MNVLAAPFLYVLPEMEAFYAFSTFIQYYCPLYVHSSLIGAHAGAKVIYLFLIEYSHNNIYLFIYLFIVDFNNLFYYFVLYINIAFRYVFTNY